MSINNNTNNNNNINNQNQNKLVIYQHNIRGFASKKESLYQNLQQQQPHVCLLQECFKSFNFDKY